jgi:hypothetical protein
MSAFTFTIIMLCITYLAAGATGMLLEAIAPPGARKPQAGRRRRARI